MGDTELAHRHLGIRADLRGGHFAQHHGMGTGHGAATCKDLVWPRTATETDPARWQTPAGFSQGTGAEPASKSLANHHMARRLGRLAHLAFCTDTRACRPSRPPAHQEPPGGMAADRVAQGGGRAHPLLSVHLACGHIVQGVGGYRQNALAHRTRLPRTEAGSRAGALRRTQLAWFSSSCELVHRRLRIPDLRKGAIPPSGSRSARLFPQLAIPAGYQPRGSAAAARAACSELNRNHAPASGSRPDQKSAAMPVLRRSNCTPSTAQKLMTQ